MTIKLSLIDDREEEPKHYVFEIGEPAVQLSVLVAARMTVKRAREHGFAGTIDAVTVHLGARHVLPGAARITYVRDGSSLIVTVLPKAASADTWNLDS